MQSKETSVNLIEKISKFLKTTCLPRTNIINMPTISENDISKIFRTHFLPKILPKEIEEELTYFFLYKYYAWKNESESVEKVLENWNKTAKEIYRKCEEYDVSFEVHEGVKKLRIRFASGTIYYPVLEMLKVDSILEGKLLKILLEKLYRSSKLLREKIRVQDFCTLLWETLKTPYNLNENELKVLNTLIRNPKAKIEEICRLTKLNPSTVTLILKKLEEKQVYTANSIVKFNKLGLKHIIVQIPAQKQIEFPHQLNNYLLSLQYLVGNKQHHLASFALPAKHIQKIKEQLTNAFNQEVIMYEVEDLQFITCLDYYDYKTHRWKINYKKLSEKIQKQSFKKKSKKLEKKRKRETQTNEDNFMFDIKDLEILRILVRNWRLSLREIAKIVKLSKNAIHKRILKLEKHKVFEPIINIHRINLTEDIALIVKSNNTDFLNTLTQIFRKLPKTTIYKLKENREEETNLRRKEQKYLFWLTLPSGDTIKFLKNFSQKIEQYGEPEIFYRWHFYSWISLPDPKLYLEKQKTWK